MSSESLDNSAALSLSAPPQDVGRVTVDVQNMDPFKLAEWYARSGYFADAKDAAQCVVNNPHRAGAWHRADSGDDGRLYYSRPSRAGCKSDGNARPEIGAIRLQGC